MPVFESSSKRRESYSRLILWDNPGRQNRINNLADKHAALLKKTLSFRSLLESERLLCDASRLAYFSHWQTPEEISIRFDTRFFLAPLPKVQTPLPTSPEVDP